LVCPTPRLTPNLKAVPLRYIYKLWVAYSSLLGVGLRVYQKTHLISGGLQDFSAKKAKFIFKAPNFTHKFLI